MSLMTGRELNDWQAVGLAGWGNWNLTQSQRRLAGKILACLGKATGMLQHLSSKKNQQDMEKRDKIREGIWGSRPVCWTGGELNRTHCGQVRDKLG